MVGRPIHLVVAAFFALAISPGSGQESVPWTSSSSYRILMEVAPVPLYGRAADDGPAEATIDFEVLLSSLGGNRLPALDTLQVVKLDSKSGTPLPYTDYAFGQGTADRPFRWYDASIPHEFSEVFAPVSYTDGERRRMLTSRGGYMYGALGDWKSGRLVWLHTQDGAGSSQYAIYFDLLPANQAPSTPPPRGWVGDAMPRHDIQGDSTTGADHTHISIDDWDGDGLDDIVYGEQYGQIAVLFNRGTPRLPHYPYLKLLFDSDGLPLDAGVHGAVLVVDWDLDGTKDLLIGTYMNRVAFYRNIGSDIQRSFLYKGLLKDADGAFLSLPVTPVARKPAGLFKEDYYPVMSAVDWNGDGERDLIAGGYITGRIYFFESLGRDGENMPQLKLRGPVEADGVPINVRDWCASPDVADLNGDGLPDIVSGAYTWSGSTGERPAFLRFYQNVGQEGAPRFTEKSLPISGDAIRLRVPNARVTDWNGDGLEDLLVASGSNIMLWKNVGTRTEPRFSVDANNIPSVWGNAPLPVGHQLIDWNSDGLIDLVNGYTVMLNSGAGNPYKFAEARSVLPDGVRIDHPTEMGDGHFWPYLHDLDQDGNFDVLFGDWHGHVWYHRNLGGDGEKAYDVAGRRLTTQDDQPIKVGPQGGDSSESFQVHQGARTKFVAGDFDSDGLDDLVVGDTFGIIRHYRNLGPRDAPTFATPTVVGNLKVRLNVEKIDWNDDGRQDIIAGVANHRVVVFLNAGNDGGARFDGGTKLDLPAIKGPEVMATDLNRDGDDDLVINGTQGTTFVERSFVRNGYAVGTVLKLETKPQNSGESR